MDKNKVLEMSKVDMKKIIDETTLDNFFDKKNVLKKYFDLIESLTFLIEDEQFLRDSVASGLITNKKNKTDKEFETKKENEQYFQNNNSTINQTFFNETEETKPVFRFERKLRGGFIPELQSFVPEGIVRSLGLEHGDYIHASNHLDIEKGDNKYFYEFYKKGNEKGPDNRCEVKFALVEKDGNTLVINQTLLNGGENIKINEVPFTFVLRDEDIYEFSLKEGDIVDFSYLSNSPEFIKVIWKHQIDSEEFSSPQTAGFYKSKTKTKKDSKNELKGKKILVIGCEPRKAVYKSQIEDRGGEFYWASGTEGKTRLSSMISKVDIVVLLIRFMRHQGSKDAVEICKSLNVPFTVVDNLGVQSLISSLINDEIA